MLMKRKRLALIITAAIISVLAVGCARKSGTVSGTESGSVSETVQAESTEAAVSTVELYETGLYHITEESWYIVNMFSYPEQCLDMWIDECEEIGMLLERDDYARIVMEHYMNIMLPPDEVTEENMRIYKTASFDEMLLSQEAAYYQLTDEERSELVSQVIANAFKRINGETLGHATNADHGHFFENILSMVSMGKESIWYEELKNMEFNGEEQQFIDAFYNLPLPPDEPGDN